MPNSLEALGRASAHLDETTLVARFSGQEQKLNYPLKAGPSQATQIGAHT